MHYVIALFDSERGDELGRVTVDMNYPEGSPTEADLLHSNSAHGVAYQYFASVFPDIDQTELRRVSLTDKPGAECQFISHDNGRAISL